MQKFVEPYVEPFVESFVQAFIDTPWYISAAAQWCKRFGLVLEFALKPNQKSD